MNLKCLNHQGKYCSPILFKSNTEELGKSRNSLFHNNNNNNNTTVFTCLRFIFNSRAQTLNFVFCLNLNVLPCHNFTHTWFDLRLPSDWFHFWAVCCSFLSSSERAAFIKLCIEGQSALLSVHMLHTNTKCIFVVYIFKWVIPINFLSIPF